MPICSCFSFCRVASAREVLRPQSAQNTIGNYKRGKELGDGAFGKVSLAEHVRTRKKVAVKVVRRRHVTDTDVDLEISLLRRCAHPHVLAVHETFSTAEEVSIVMELAHGGNLKEYLRAHGRLHENRGRYFFLQLMSAAEHCHNSNVAHRDLKLENVLLDDSFNLKVADFGLAREMVDGEVFASACGSPNYAAPEILHFDIAQYQGAPADIYSCGVLLFALFCNHFPFQADNRQELYKLMKLGRYRVPGYLSRDVLDMLRLMLTVSPSDRIGCPGINAHAWVNVQIPSNVWSPCS